MMLELRRREEQIVGTQEKPQWIVAQRLLSHLQYLDATKSSTKDLTTEDFRIIVSWQYLCRCEPTGEIRTSLFLFM